MMLTRAEKEVIVLLFLLYIILNMNLYWNIYTVCLAYFNGEPVPLLPFIAVPIGETMRRYAQDLLISSGILVKKD
jgi:hypothetical protein